MWLKYLFVFENLNETILEVKLVNQPEGTPPEKVYFWLVVNNITGACTQLNFVSMQKEPEQVRVFKQGTLKFNAKVASFETDNHFSQYSAISSQYISEIVNKAVVNFLETFR